MFLKIILFFSLLMIPVLIIVEKWLIYLEDIKLAKRIMEKQSEEKANMTKKKNESSTGTNSDANKIDNGRTQRDRISTQGNGKGW